LSTDLPYIDEHTVRIDAPRALAWSALRRYVDTLLRSTERNPLVALLAAEPRAGFRIAESIEHRQLSLVGRHRFSRYQLVFELDDLPEGDTRLRARTYAAFPGLHGRIYRTLVIGTRLHVVATNLMLRSIRRYHHDRDEWQIDS
jgi:hypothetical protein